MYERLCEEKADDPAEEEEEDDDDEEEDEDDEEDEDEADSSAIEQNHRDPTGTRRKPSLLLIPSLQMIRKEIVSDSFYDVKFLLNQFGDSPPREKREKSLYTYV